MDHPVHRPVRTTTSSRGDLTTPPHNGPKKNQWNTSDSEVAGSVTPSHTINGSSQTRPRHQAHRWIEVKCDAKVGGALATAEQEHLTGNGLEGFQLVTCLDD